MNIITIFDIKRGMTIVCVDGSRHKVKEVQQSFIDDLCVVYVTGNKEIKLKDVVAIEQ